MAVKRKTDTAECEQEAVRLIPDHHDGVAEAAWNFDVNVNTSGVEEDKQRPRQGPPSFDAGDVP